MKNQIEKDIALIETHLVGIQQKVAQLEANLERERQKIEVLLAENRRLQEEKFDLRRQTGTLFA